MQLKEEVTLETMQALKSRGFTRIRFKLKDFGNSSQAIVEVIPGKGESFSLDTISLNSREILDYFEEPSPMARYIINRNYLSA